MRVLHAWYVCLAYGRGAHAVRYDLGPLAGSEEYRPITPPARWDRVIAMTALLCGGRAPHRSIEWRGQPPRIRASVHGTALGLVLLAWPVLAWRVRYPHPPTRYESWGESGLANTLEG